jgi:hypothetical protein
VFIGSRIKYIQNANSPLAVPTLRNSGFCASSRNEITQVLSFLKNPRDGNP